jgi:MFS transporter, DHA2 family, multidrug resistance protein
VLNAGYRSGLSETARGVPGEVVARAQESLASALGVAEQLGNEDGALLAEAAREAFVGGLSASLLAGALILAVAAIGVLLLASNGGGSELVTGKEGEKV